MARRDSLKLPAKWRKLLTLSPGYDPFRSPGGAWFEPAIADRAIGFFHECLTHVEGEMARKPFILEPWQQCIIANLFGWQRLDHKGRQVRRYREAFIFIPRKNGKTPLAAGICNYVLFCDNEPGAQIYSAAAEREQAALLYRQAKGMIENEPELMNRAKIYAGTGHRSIVLKSDEASSYKVLSADADTKHGGTSHLVIVDELHAQPNRDLVDVLQTSMASENRKQPLLIHITTSDYDRESICNEKHDYAAKVRDGVIDDPAFLPVIYEATTKDDWRHPKTWAKANPNLGVSVSLDYLERECKRAQETPTYENTFKRLHLNIKTEQAVRWMPLELWDRCGSENPAHWRAEAIARLRGESCVGGLDLSSTEDLTVLSLLFDDGTVLPWFFAPADNAERKERRDRVPYITWAREGFIELTPGDSVDYGAIFDRVKWACDEFTVRKIGCDPWNATQLVQQLQAQGLPVEIYAQNTINMAPPTKELMRLVTAKEICHGGHPVLRWNAANCAAITDRNENVLLHKSKSSGRIDGVVATIIGVGVRGQPIESLDFYNTHELEMA